MNIRADPGDGTTSARWKTGLAYRVHALDHTGGELDGEAFSRISPFHQAPVIDDDGFNVAESAAVVLYLAEKAGKLIPKDFQGRTRVAQWCFAAVSTVAPTLMCLDVIEMFDRDKVAHKVTAEVRKPAGRWLADVERRLEGRGVDRPRGVHGCRYHDGETVLREIRKSDFMERYPRITAYYARCMARPAWQRTLGLYAERVGVKVDDIR